MSLARTVWNRLTFGTVSAPAARRHRSPRLDFSWDCLEERKVLSHTGGIHQHAQAVANTVASAFSTATVHGRTHNHTGGSTGTGSTSTTNSAVTTALQTLHSDVQSIELASGTTVGQLAAIRAGFQTLAADGLTPSSRSALSSFEDSLVTSLASGTTLTGNTSLLSQFETLYTSSPTAQQTTDLTTAYNALAAAVTSSNVSAANITTINTDWSAVLAAENSTSTATYPYFSLVTGGNRGAGGGGGCH